MLPKAVLSLLGRVVAIAVVAFPFAASAAEPAQQDGASAQGAARSTPDAAKPSVHHSHHGKVQKHAKRGSRRVEAAAANSEKSEPKSSRHVTKDAPPPEVTVEKTSARPPRPSSTPLPCIAANTTKPIVEPVEEQEPVAKRVVSKEPAAREPAVAKEHAGKEHVAKERVKKTAARKLSEGDHAVEPKRTPILFMTHEPSKAAESGKTSKGEKASKGPKITKSDCLHAPVGVTRGTEERWFSLTKCDGTAAPLAVDSMSILVRPGSATKPEAPIAELVKKGGEELAPGIKRVDARIVERLQLVVDHFAKAEKAPPKIFVVSGYRPTSKGSFHAIGRAIDFRIDGVENTDLVAFCKTLPDTGCGFYPNSSFIHLDIRDAGTGHVAWIDASSPGEKPQYVASWPPPPEDKDETGMKLLSKLDELQLLPSGDSSDAKKDDATEDEAKDDGAKLEKSEAASIAKEREE